MLITAIEPFKGSKYNIFVEGEYALTADIEIIAQMGLKAGKQVSREDLDEIRRRGDSRRAHERALYLLSFRAHSRKELSDKLLKNYDEQTVEEILDRLTAAGLLDDAAYAELRARDLIERKDYGEKRVRQELRMRGIDGDIIDKVLQNCEKEDTQDRLQSLIETKYRRKLLEPRGRERVTAALLRRGYAYEEIRRALNALEEEEED